MNQTRPELCGKADAPVALPSGIAVTIDRSTDTAAMFLGEGITATKLDLPGIISELAEVCPLPDGNRLLLFGDTSNGENMILVNVRDRQIVDSFEGFYPALSPNQRWLVYRKFYPRHVLAPVTEEYLLYDLNKTAGQNRPQGIGTDDRYDVGSPVFPLGLKNLLIDNLGVDESQTHRPSSGFYWAQDSGAFLFGDILNDSFSLVVITVGSDGSTSAYEHTVHESEVCKGDPALSKGYLPSIAHAEIGPDESDRLLNVDFQTIPGVCDGKSLEFHMKGLDRPAMETHKKPHMLKSVVTN
jgi:hypothetical protein